MKAALLVSVLKRTRFFLLILLPLIAARASNLGGYSGTSNRMLVDPVAAGTGGITLFAAASENAYAHNPASQAWNIEKRFHSGMVLLSLDRYTYFIHSSAPLPPTAHLSAGLIAAGTKAIEARDSRGYAAGELTDGEMTYILAFSNRFSDQLAFGLTFKLLSKQLASEEGWLDLKGTGFGANFGLSFKSSANTTFALAIKDWNSSYKWKTQDVFDRGDSYQDKFPMSVAWGVHQQLGGVEFVFEHDHYFVGEDLFRASTMLTAIENLRVNAGFSFEDENFFPGLSARYIHTLRGTKKLHIDIGVTLGAESEGLRQYLGWGVNF